MITLIMTLKRHVERAGYHLDRFDALVDDELIVVSRQPRHDGARKLLELGHDPETLLHVQHHGRAFDPTIVPETIEELAKWTVTERDRGGLRRERFESWSETSGVASPAADAGPAAIPVPAQAA